MTFGHTGQYPKDLCEAVVSIKPSPCQLYTTIIEEPREASIITIIFSTPTYYRYSLAVSGCRSCLL